MTAESGHARLVRAPTEASAPRSPIAHDERAAFVQPALDAFHRSSGLPLEPLVRRDMEDRFGADFGDVRVHADADAQDSAEALGARAYTHGSDIAFGAGRYAPGTPAGRHLLAHELAHVVQQRRGGSPPPLDPSAAHEVAAHAAADAATAGTGRAVVRGSSGVGVARAPEDPSKSAAVARDRIDRAARALDALQARVEQSRKQGGQISVSDALPAYDAVSASLQRARAVRDPALIATAEALARRYDAITGDTPAARGVSPFSRPQAASGVPMGRDDAHRVVTAQRGFNDGLPAHQVEANDKELARLKQELLAAGTPEEAAALRQRIDTLANRAAISSPRLKDLAELAKRKADLQAQLQTATAATDQRRLKRLIAGVDAEVSALRSITDPAARPPAAALEPGRIGHSGNTYVTIQVVDANGELVATVQARNKGNGGAHAEEVALEQLETFPAKSRFEGATMIITGDQEVCADVCRPAVSKFAAKYKFRQAVGDTTHAPAMTSQGRLTGKPSTAKTTVGKLADPLGVDKIEQAQRAAGQLGADEPVKLSQQRETIYSGPPEPARGKVPRSAKGQSSGAIPRLSPHPRPGAGDDEAEPRRRGGGVAGEALNRAFRRERIETLPLRPEPPGAAKGELPPPARAGRAPPVNADLPPPASAGQPAPAKRALPPPVAAALPAPARTDVPPPAAPELPAPGKPALPRPAGAKRPASPAGPTNAETRVADSHVPEAPHESAGATKMQAAAGALQLAGQGAAMLGNYIQSKAADAAYQRMKPTIEAMQAATDEGVWIHFVYSQHEVHPDSEFKPVPEFKYIELQEGSRVNKRVPALLTGGNEQGSVTSTWLPPGRSSLKSELADLWDRQKRYQHWGERESKRTFIGRFLLERKGSSIDLAPVYEARAHLVSAGIALEQKRAADAQASMKSANAALDVFLQKAQDYTGKTDF
jgi:hypothetical protein